VEKKKLEINSVSLASVTQDFLEFLKKSGPQIEPALLADFLVVAAKLLLIKSKTLLPEMVLSDDEEKEIKDLESRLAIYREFAARPVTSSGPSASAHLFKSWNQRLASFSKPLFSSLTGQSFFYPAPNLNLTKLKAALNKLLSEFETLFPKPSKIKSIIVTLEEKIKELVSRFREAVKHSFLGLAEKRSRSEVIVMFLAVLHLLRDKVIHAEQEKQFGDIIIEKM